MLVRSDNEISRHLKFNNFIYFQLFSAGNIHSADGTTMIVELLRKRKLRKCPL